MTLTPLWKFLLTFALVILAENMANWNWNKRQMGTFAFWIVLMIFGIITLIFI